MKLITTKTTVYNYVFPAPVNDEQYDKYARFVENGFYEATSGPSESEKLFTARIKEEITVRYETDENNDNVIVFSFNETVQEALVLRNLRFFF